MDAFLDEFEEPEQELSEEEEREQELEKVVQHAAEQALLWREEELEWQQAKATDYYMGRPFGNETEGRSRVVSTDVRDTIQAILPSLMRIFFGPENTVEYEPRKPEDVPAAEQLTDMANYVVRIDNNGFLQIYGAMKDAMVRLLGVLKVWHEQAERTEGYEYTGLSEAAMVELEADEDVELEVRGSYEVAVPGSPTGFITLYDALAVRRHDEGVVRFEAVPPEEFIFSPEARDRDSCEMMGHVRSVPASELIAMGIDPELVEQHKGKTYATKTSGDDLEVARRFDQDQREAEHDEHDDAREDCWFGEIFVHADMEGDGTTSLVCARVIGDNHELVDWEYCDERPFAIFVCDPEPHTLIGTSTADTVMDIQLIKSSIIRAQLDSLTLALNQRLEVVEGEVNMADVLNNEVGAIIRVDKPGMLREVAHDFSKTGGAAFPMLQYMDEQKENRTGISKAAAGLDADALQSATKAAVAATLSGAQQHIELLARIFAETGMKQLYSLILKTLVKHQDQARTIRVRNEWVEMDPRAWHANMDVRINLALGVGSSEEKLMLMDAITQHQKMLLDEGSPLVSQVQYRAGLARQVELAGFPNANEFYQPWTAEQKEQYQQQKAQQPPQDPAMIAVQGQLEIEKAKLRLDEQEMILKDIREKAKIQMDFAIKQATAEAQYGVQISNQELMADQATAKAIIDAAAKEAIAKAQGGPTSGQQGIPAGAGGGGGQAP
jgi:hypothetical protein